jgi:ABC-type glycerol-3-phosphate transport system permease component
MVYGTLLAIGVFCLVPFTWLLLASFDAHASVYLQAPRWTFENFVHFWQDATAQDLLNSLIIAGGGTILCIGLSCLCGYAFSRFRFPARRTLLYGILLVRVIPQTATITPLYIIVLDLHLNNSYIGIILVEAALNLPLIIWLMKGIFDSIPSVLEEAAWVDGASHWQSLWRVMLPLALPGLGASALFAFIAIWSDFLTPLVLLQSQSLYPLSIGLFRAYTSYYQVDWGLLAATAFVYTLPAVCLYLAVRRYLLRATLSGAVKG